jgi:hypothetical protein
MEVLLLSSAAGAGNLSCPASAVRPYQSRIAVGASWSEPIALPPPVCHNAAYPGYTHPTTSEVI